MNSETKPDAILLASCPDQPGIVAAATNLILEHRGNILDLDQHVDRDANTFLMRIAWQHADASFKEAFSAIADRFNMKREIRDPRKRSRIALFVTRESHCLFDIMARHQSGEWEADIPLIISNREDLRPVVEGFGIPFHVFPITKETKAEQEDQELALLKEHNIDTVVLARYMQILAGSVLEHYKHRMLNIHHSFLPAFPGAKPYHAAYARGVKIIGATCHYVTADLDEGPIIEQDVIRVSHRDDVQDFKRKGKDAEKIVLARGITAHIGHRVIVYGSRTVVF